MLSRNQTLLLRFSWGWSYRKITNPEPELTTKAKESRALAEEGMAVTDEENSNEVAATEPTEENEEKPLEATGEDEIAAALEE